ncbi:MAG: phosphoglycerate kinase, partial [Sphingobium sp. 32-64-5]
MGDIRGKAVLVREDLNVPMHDGVVSDDTRLRAAMPTVNELSDRGAKVLILAHFGRPRGQANPDMSLAMVTQPLSGVLGRPVAFIADCQGAGAKAAVDALPEGAIAVLENTRFHAGEEKNDPALADAMAALGDYYVNDAFSAVHRAHASTEGLAHRLPAFAGRSME